MYVQVFILDSLATYQCQDLKEAEKIAERVMPRLQHVNSAVVLSAIKVGVCVCVSRLQHVNSAVVLSAIKWCVCVVSAILWCVS